MSNKPFDLIEVMKRMFEANLMQDVNIPQKDLANIPKPPDRPVNWIEYGCPIAFVILDNRNKPRIRTGHIASTAGTSHVNVDNVTSTIVWSDQTLNDLADTADDAHEESFNPKDPRLLRLDEVEVLRDTNRAIIWFEGVYPPEVARHISVLFTLPDFGRQEELDEEGKIWREALETAKNKLGHYDENWKFHPPVAAV